MFPRDYYQWFYGTDMTLITEKREALTSQISGIELYSHVTVTVIISKYRSQKQKHGNSEQNELNQEYT